MGEEGREGAPYMELGSHCQDFGFYLISSSEKISIEYFKTPLLDNFL